MSKVIPTTISGGEFIDPKTKLSYFDFARKYTVSVGENKEYGIYVEGLLLYEPQFDFPTATMICEILNDAHTNASSRVKLDERLDWEWIETMLEERGWKG